jgi:Calcineurin-like phosphoesterase superfamily domain
MTGVSTSFTPVIGFFPEQQMDQRDQPERIMVAGDTHCNTRWTVGLVETAARLKVDRILQVGDFGFWNDSGGQYFMDCVQLALEAKGLYLEAIDGNHEDYAWMGSWREPGYPATTAVHVPGHNRIWHLPRGHTWEWHGRSWLACGGATSVDRALRTYGEDWWPEEEISEEQEHQIIASGKHDVMVTHDCPAEVVMALPPARREWLPYMPAAEAHRERLSRIVNAVQPSYLLHGHYHRLYGRPVEMPYGTCQVTGLGMDETVESYRILNVRTMEWETGSA